MNTALAETEPNLMSNGRHLDISPRVFVDRYSALGFERKVLPVGQGFVHHRERIVVEPVFTECGSIDRWHTLRRLEETLDLHRARKRGNRMLIAAAAVCAAALIVLFWPSIVAAETRRDVIDQADEAGALSLPPVATCALSYTLGPRESTVLQCTHRLRGAYTVERLRSGNDRVLISPARTVNRGDSLTITLLNVTDGAVQGTAYIEFW